MRITKTFSAAFCALAIAPSVASAITLSLEVLPGVEAIQTGEYSYLSLRASGLDVGSPTSLGAFDVSISYDAAVLGYEASSFSNWLGNPGSSALTFVDQTTPGILNFTEVSLLTDIELDALQTVESIVLATMTFKGLYPGGFSPITLDYIDLSDAFGFQIGPDEVVNASVLVSVPESSILMGLVMGLFGLAVVRRA